MTKVTVHVGLEYHKNSIQVCIMSGWMTEGVIKIATKRLLRN